MAWGPWQILLVLAIILILRRQEAAGASALARQVPE